MGQLELLPANNGHSWIPREDSHRSRRQVFGTNISFSSSVQLLILGMLFRPFSASAGLLQAGQSSRVALLEHRCAGRSSLPPHYRQPFVAPGHRHLSSPPPQNSRSQFKILPFVVILVVGTGAYVLLVRSRASARNTANQRN